ncbi:hypothetical protein HDU92_006913 [Lobulomyces angularis]|nr:hypothetical protein HDU92_006913 [Lobulomyces angularis]
MITLQTLKAKVKQLRINHWFLQKRVGIDHIPSNDFSLYDTVLDHHFLFGLHTLDDVKVDAIVSQKKINQVDEYFNFAKNLELRKWFDTKYNYFYFHLNDETNFKLTSIEDDNFVLKPVRDFLEAKEIGIITRPVLIGPITYLLLNRNLKDDTFNPLNLLPKLLPLYEEILSQLKLAGAEWIQFDEPCLVLENKKNFEVEMIKSLKFTYETVLNEKKFFGLKFFIATYFEDIPDYIVPTVLNLPISALHLDLSNSLDILSSENFLSNLPDTLDLSFGLINGKNVWKNNLKDTLKSLTELTQRFGNDKRNFFLSPSCSLIHIPHSLNLERGMDDSIKSLLSFGLEKLEETFILAKGINEGLNSIISELVDNQKIFKLKKNTMLNSNPEVLKKINSLRNSDINYFKREESFEKRSLKQIQLPLFPTTTIGSFPRTKKVRLALSKYNKGEWNVEEYENFIKEEIKNCIMIQEEIGLDVLVHGEFERNFLMSVLGNVEYFADHLEGFIFTEYGWIQSNGVKLVKPPIIYGDVFALSTLTVKWALYAQSLTKKPVKGMLTGPTTILQWSFVRDDQSLSTTAYQIAFALRDEVKALEEIGLRIIQVDESGLKEGLPLRKFKRDKYLEWSVNAFLIATSGVKSSTQIHTHMCYSEFDDLMESIKRMDADVVTVENSKHDFKLLNAFKKNDYKNFVGPGILDVHSNDFPSIEKLKLNVFEILNFIEKNKLWLNPGE